jgi:hypothetical protein
MAPISALRTRCGLPPTSYGGSRRGHDHAGQFHQRIQLGRFQEELEKFMAGHMRRKALIQHLVKAGIWEDK